MPSGVPPSVIVDKKLLTAEAMLSFKDSIDSIVSKYAPSRVNKTGLYPYRFSKLSFLLISEILSKFSNRYIW